MLERRHEVRTPLDATGRIALDEHHSVRCIVFDRSPRGVRVALPDADTVPDTFMLTIDGSGESLVCRAAWRCYDEIGCHAVAVRVERAARPTLRRVLVPA